MAGSGPGILEKEGSKPVVLCDCPAGFGERKRENRIDRCNFKLTHALAGGARESPCLNLKDKGSVAWNDVRRQEPFEDINGTGFFIACPVLLCFTFLNPVPQTLGNCYSSVGHFAPINIDIYLQTA
jgi:hypothetical protein